MRRSTLLLTIGLSAAFLLSSVGLPPSAVATRPVRSDSGFVSPFAGTPRFVRLAPTEITDPSQLNRPLGQRAADRLAARLGLSRADVFTHAQYVAFITGKGVGGRLGPAALVDKSVRILTNTQGRPLYSKVNGTVTATVLASYGLFVSSDGMLESPANEASPARQVNRVIEPGHYLGTWCRANGAQRSLDALYRSAYPRETAYGYAAQQQSADAQLVTNTKQGTAVQVGMSMAPALWFTNFLLIYTLNPKLAADLPARWAPIPDAVASAMLASPHGRVPYSDVADLLP